MAKREKVTVLGIDVGASGIKGAVVDIRTGEFLTERIKYATPKPATPRAVASVIKKLAKAVDWQEGDLVGCGFPAVIVRGVAHSAANIDNAWIGRDAESYLSERTGFVMKVVNDADAAGMAEVEFGHVDKAGCVLLLTIGTGIGSALFYNGMLIPNTELGHIPYRRSVAEDYVSNRARKDRKLSISKWARELNEYLIHINRIITPDLIILGGGISKKFQEYEALLSPGVPVIPAKQFNNAGIVGAALYAYHESKNSAKTK